MGSDYNLKTINGLLNAQWDTYPSKVAFIFHDDDDYRSALTNRDVRELSVRAASFLFSHGVHRGDVVCNLLLNSWEREIVNFGILLAGAVVMHGDVIDGKGRAFWMPIVQAKAKFIVVSPDPNTPGWKALKEDVGKSDAEVEVMTRTPEAKDVYKVFKFSLAHLLKVQKQFRKKLRPCFDIINQHQSTMNERVSAHDPCCILVEKDAAEKHYLLVSRNHGEMVQIAQRLDEMLGVRHDDVIYCDFPLSWMPGLLYHYITLGCTMIRSTLIDCPPRKVVNETWDLVDEEKCTLAAFDPKALQMLASHCEDLVDHTPSLRAATTSGFVRQSVMDAIGTCAHSIVICYAKIETGLVACHRVDDHNKDVYAEGCVGDMTCPVALEGSTLVDDHRWTEPATPVGEIMLDGGLVAKEYLNDRALTRSKFTVDGYLHTGDIGFYDEKKRLFVLGRKSEAIIRDNVPIFPREIEEKVNQCPGIWKVKVVSVKDSKGIIQMCACVIPRSDDTLTIEGVKEFCRYQLGGTSPGDDNPHMPTYIFFFDSYPTIGGQVNRRLLAYMAAEILHGNPRDA